MAPTVGYPGGREGPRDGLGPREGLDEDGYFTCAVSVQHKATLTIHPQLATQLKVFEIVLIPNFMF